MRNTLIKNALLITCAVLIIGSSCPIMAADVLLQESDLEYLGAFRLPSGAIGCSDESQCSFHYSSGNTFPAPIAYNSQNNSLFVTGHIYNQWVAEVAIPSLINTSNLNSLNTANVLQSFADLANGKRSNLGPGESLIDNGGILAGMLMNGSKLLISDYAYYDAAYEAVYSHFTANTNWTQNGVGFSGMKTVGEASASGVGKTAGYMARIPSSWQQQLGGTALTGRSNIAIISRTSYGPAIFSFDPDNVGVSNPTPATALCYYDNDHQTLGIWDNNPTQYVAKADMINGVVFPEGSRSILFFGRHGSTNCYGTGAQCNDPTADDQGVHSYPYEYQVWAYDANDLVAVKNGSSNPWDPIPYTVWNFNLPFENDSRIIAGVAYDPATQRIYVSQDHGDGNMPVIHAFRVNLSVLPQPPAAPENLRIKN